MKNERKSRRVAVLGGGPAGLSATYRLASDDTPIEVDLYEESTRFGGAVTSVKGGGFIYEMGPNSMNAKHQQVADLIYDKLNLSPHVLKRNAAAKNYFVVRNGQMIPMPRSPFQFCTTKMLSWRAKLRILVEPFIPKAPETNADRESVGDFFRRRFGSEFVDYVVDPALAGIYSTNPTGLSMKHALKRVWEIERKKGSVIGGFLRGGVKSDVDPRFQMYSGKQLRESFSYDSGMQALTTRLVENIEKLNKRGKLYRNVKVRSVSQDPRGAWRINGRGRYDAVISTIPAYTLEDVESNVEAVRNGFKKLAKRVEYAPVSVTVLGFDKSQISSRLDGYGVLVPTKEQRKLLGINFTSSNYPSRAEDPNKVYLTVYLGGSRTPDIVSLPSDEIVETATKEVQQVLGVTGRPFHHEVKNWPKGIPQYRPGYDSALDTMAQVERRAPGLVLGGNYRDGVGLPDALLSGLKSAERVIEYLQVTMPK